VAFSHVGHRLMDIAGGHAFYRWFVVATCSTGKLVQKAFAGTTAARSKAGCGNNRARRWPGKCSGHVGQLRLICPLEGKRHEAGPPPILIRAPRARGVAVLSIQYCGGPASVWRRREKARIEDHYPRAMPGPIMNLREPSEDHINPRGIYISRAAGGHRLWLWLGKEEHTTLQCDGRR
jgi:hypothetical protein